MATASTGGGVTTVGVATGYQKISPGILTQVSLSANKTFQPVGEQFWSLHLCYGTSIDDGVQSTLLAGYIQYPNAITWHGFLEIPNHQYMILEGVGVNWQAAEAIETRITLNLNGRLTQYLTMIQRQGRL